MDKNKEEIVRNNLIKEGFKNFSKTKDFKILKERALNKKFGSYLLTEYLIAKETLKQEEQQLEKSNLSLEEYKKESDKLKNRKRAFQEGETELFAEESNFEKVMKQKGRVTISAVKKIANIFQDVAQNYEINKKLNSQEPQINETPTSEETEEPSERRVPSERPKWEIQANPEEIFSTTSPDRPVKATPAPTSDDAVEKNPLTTPEKKESALGAEMDSFVDNGIETSNEMALSIMPNDSIDDMSTAQKETFGQIADAIRRVMMETNLTGDTETIVKERPDAIKDANLHPKKNVNNDVIFRDLGKQVRGELKSLQLAGNKADQREIITKVVQDNIGKINFTPNPNSPVEQVFGKGENTNPHPKKPTLSLREQQESSPFAQTRTTPVSFDEKKKSTPTLGSWRTKKKLF